MNSERLLAYYEKIADGPDAIVRLRRFILDLAVRGKLVPQDASNEPAAELLKRIAKEKARLVKAGEIRALKAIPPVSETSFPIPSNWSWSQLAEIGLLSPRNEASDALEASFVPMPLIAAEYGVANQHEVRPWGEIKKGYTHFAEGDVGLAKITPCFENGKSAVFRSLTGGIGAGTTELHIVRPLFVDPDYILLFLKCPHFIELGIPKMTGTAGQKRVPTEYFAHSPFPLPPLAEQHRIVSKVDELMGLCDRLEAARVGREAMRDQLAVASLARLNAPDPETFQADARFVLNVLPAITTRPDQIKALRQSILNLAVRGKLVPQDPKDGPAAQLLKQVEMQRSTLVNSGALRRIDLVEPMSERPPFDVPQHWAWALPDQLSSLTKNALTIGPFGSSLVKSDYRESGVPLVFVADVTSEFRMPPKRFIDARKAIELKSHTVAPGDLVITKMGDPPGTTAIYPTDRPAGIISADCIKWAVDERLTSTKFLYLLLRAQIIASQIMEITKGAAHQKVSLKRFRSIYIPVPPLAEQYRIVAKVDELMALCDRLEASLTGTVAIRRRLLVALLAEALAPAEEREEAA